MKQLRGRTDLTQYEAAYELNVPPRTYQSWENGEVETSRENYRKVADLFGVTVNWILFGQDEEPPMPSETPAATEADLRNEIREFEESAVARHAELMAELAEVRSLLTHAETPKQQGQRRKAAKK
jgi:DNA-binding XRE family transcriptional regulator